MNTPTNEQQMNYTFQRVASLCGLRLSFYVTAALLAATFFILVFTTYRTASPLYILLTLALMPSLLRSMLFSGTTEKEKRENTLAFPLFCKKYRYDSASYKAMNLAYLLIFILLAAWHVSYRNFSGDPVYLTALPMGTAVISLLTRLLGTLGYRIYFHRFPLKAMH